MRTRIHSIGADTVPKDGHDVSRILADAAYDDKKNRMKEVGYGTPWKVESAFSDIKRMFGDTIRARSRGRVEGIIRRIISAHNIYKSIGAGL